MTSLYGLVRSVGWHTCIGAAFVALVAGGPVKAQTAPPNPVASIATEYRKTAKNTVVLVLISPDCEICVDAMPFYKRILAMPGMDGIERRFIVLTRDGVVPVARVLKANDLHPHEVTSGPAATGQIEPVPTLIVVKAAGKGQAVWRGRLSAAQEAAVIKAIEAP